MKPTKKKLIALSIKIRIVFLLFIIIVFTSVLELSTSRWSLHRSIQAYTTSIQHDQVHDWAQMIGLLYSQHHSWSILKHDLLSKHFSQLDGMILGEKGFIITSSSGNIISNLPNGVITSTWLSSPIAVGTHVIGVLHVRPYSPVHLLTLQRQNTVSFTYFQLFILFLVILLLMLLGVPLLNNILRPLEQLALAAKGIVQHNYTVPLPDVQDEEVQAVVQAFRSVQMELLAAQTARDTMISNLYHELRTPMSIIANRMEAVQCGLYELDLQNILIIHDEILRMERLLGDLRQLNDADAKALHLEYSPIDVCAWMNQIIELFKLDAKVGHIELYLYCSPNLSTLFGDERRLTQVLINLLSNALRFSPKGKKIVVSAEYHPEIEGHQFSICDEGIGIPREHLPHIFDRFYRIDDSRNRGTGGLGLGLAISKEIINAHGGNISVESTVNKGTCFTIQLPREHLL